MREKQNCNQIFSLVKKCSPLICKVQQQQDSWAAKMSTNKKIILKDKKRYLIFSPVSILLIISFIYSSCYATEYPYRDNYSFVNIIEPAELKTGYDSGEFIIVDVRSKTEFEAIQISGAVNLPYGNLKFTHNLLTLAGNNPDKKIAVYCNGIDCIKSYKAAEDALYLGMSNVYALDAGVAAWAKEYPSATLIQGKTLTDPEKLIHDDNIFQKICLDFETFKKNAAKKDTVIIDARDPIQRSKKLPGLDNPLQVPLDKLVKNIINKGNMKDKELYIFDQVGKQVRWLTYKLIDQGYTHFYFLEGGATSVLKEQQYR